MTLSRISLNAQSYLLGCFFIAACSRSTLSGSEGAYSYGSGGQGIGGAPIEHQQTPVFCERNSDCNDHDDCTADSCKKSRCENVLRDDDGDGFASGFCKNGYDCNDKNAEMNPSAVESCSNGIDDNCDGAVDCNDAACAGRDSCGICATYETSCSDGVDNDCDGRRDCADAECFLTSACPCSTSETNCSDQVDSDCDGLFDCADPDCKNKKECSCNSSEDCTNQRDDDCDGLVDCLDDQCKTSGACACLKAETNCVDGKNEDCDSTIDCNDSDCMSTTACQCRTSIEDCSNEVDDNCNDLVDCRDPSCKSTAACDCPNGVRKEVCSDAVDNDCDGLRDCMDPDCLGSSSCKSCLVDEICDDKTDNDCDGFVDCQDPECLGKSEKCRPVSEICNDGKDNDFDQFTDCADPDCRTNDYCKVEHATCVTAQEVTASGSYTGTTTGHPIEYVGSCGGHGSEAIFALILSAPSRVTVDTIGTDFDAALYLRTGVCAEGPEIACNDDAGPQDNSFYAYSKLELSILYPGIYYLFVDGFAATDFGVDSGEYIANISIEPNPKEICDNGIDDDGDVYADCADSDCATQSRCKCNSPTKARPEFGVEACTDGIDNDCDGLIDRADIVDCRASNYPTEFCNGIDDNGNNIIDDFACRCQSDADCLNGEICYTLTTHACSLPCDNFVGSNDSGVCPAIANGSVCSASWQGGSGQCVYP